ncbi:MAG: EamA family transporter [Ardenticatenaceae bacterium]|nr:EamA family transporter [Anaerolineales bacterium]MCB8941173.1 EamA family transporter [Ardenticatenaceae bacterium]MCB8972511.1 EamA family transporter [Ardenticatenaceae bacterium]
MKLKNFLLLIFLAALWGPSFLFIKVAVAEIPPITLVLGRVGIAAVLLTVFLLVQGKSLPRSRTVWRHLAVMGLIHNTIPFVLFGWGEQYIDSALASILNGTTPLFTIIIAHFFATDDQLTPAKLTGILVGFAGLILLITPSFGDGMQGTTLGLLAVALAAVLYGVAIVYTRNNLRGLPPLVAPAGQMILASLYLLPLSLLLERPYTLSFPSLTAVGSMLALGVLGTAVAFVVYYRLLETAPASYVSMTTYIIPVFGVILGVLVLKEQLTWHAYAGFALILLGVMIVNGLLKWGGKRPFTLARPAEKSL